MDHYGDFLDKESANIAAILQKLALNTKQSINISNIKQSNLPFVHF
jgi:chloramphenicol O-acetyltransferase